MPALRWRGANPPGWASLQLHRLTFAMLMDDRRDLGGLDVLQVPSGVGQHVNAFPRRSFLQGAPCNAQWTAASISYIWDLRIVQQAQMPCYGMRRLVTMLI